MKKIWIIITLLLLVAIVSLQIISTLGLMSPHGKQIVCPVNAIKMHNGKAIIDNDKCIGCTRCVNGFYPVNNKKEDAADSALSATSSFATSANSSSENKAISADNNANSTEDKATSANNKQIPLGKTATSKDIKTNPATSKTTPKNYHKVNTQECIGCGLCVKACPTNAISMKNGKAIIDKNKCINCGICRGINEDVFAGCPVDAITAVGDSL